MQAGKFFCEGMTYGCRRNFEIVLSGIGLAEINLIGLNHLGGRVWFATLKASGNFSPFGRFGDVLLGLN